MKRDEAISRLQQHEADLKRLGVEHLYMFDSTARNAAAPARKRRLASGVRRNAYRHGLSINAHLGGNSEIVESLARQIAGGCTVEDILHYANLAHLTLARIRQVKLDVIERTRRFGSLKPLPRFRSAAAEIRFLKVQPHHQALRWPEPVDPLGPMPLDDPDRTAEAVRRILPELRKLHRYERRAIKMRDDALREIRLRSGKQIKS